MKKFNPLDKVKIVDTNDIWENKSGIVIKESDTEIITEEGEDLTLVKVKINFSEDGSKTVIQEFPRQNIIKEIQTETLNESVKENKMDKETIKKYVYVEDMDDKLVPTWMFLDKIAVAEDVELMVIYELAREAGCKIYCVEASKFCKEVVAAKEVKAEDIYDSYACYLQGQARVFEVK